MKFANLCVEILTELNQFNWYHRFFAVFYEIMTHIFNGNAEITYFVPAMPIIKPTSGWNAIGLCAFGGMCARDFLNAYHRVQLNWTNVPHSLIYISHQPMVVWLKWCLFLQQQVEMLINNTISTDIFSFKANKQQTYYFK